VRAITARRRHPAAGYIVVLLGLLLAGLCYAAFTGIGTASAASQRVAGQPLIAEGKAMQDQPARSRWFATRMMARTSDWAERIMTPLQGCMSNERVRAVMTSFAQ